MRDFKFCIDRGGTFTDVYADVPDPKKPYRIVKLLSEDRNNYKDVRIDVWTYLTRVGYDILSRLSRHLEKALEGY